MLSAKDNLLFCNVQFPHKGDHFSTLDTLTRPEIPKPLPHPTTPKSKTIRTEVQMSKLSSALQYSYVHLLENPIAELFVSHWLSSDSS